MIRVYLEKYNAICALGPSIDLVFEKMTQGKTGIKKRNFQFEEDKTFPMAAFQKEDLLSFKGSKNVFQDLCLKYIKDLIKNTDCDFSRKETLLILSTTKGNIKALKEDKEAAALSNLLPFFEENLQTKNKPVLISNACISGVVALNYAHDLIKTDRYKKVVVCAADFISDFVVSGFNTFQALSTENCQPYDVHRKGVTLGEACAVALISSTPSEIQLLGGASSNDANHISGPSRDGSGLALAIKKTLKSADLSSIDFINAHGTATGFNDEMECKAFHSLGLQNTPLNSLKAYFGHTLGAAGLLEILVCAKMIQKETALASLGLQERGLSLYLNVLKENKTYPLNTILKTASGFGGCNAATILQKA